MHMYMEFYYSLKTSPLYLRFCTFIVLSLDAMDVSGEQHINVEHNIYKRRLDLNGSPLEKPEKEASRFYLDLI